VGWVSPLPFLSGPVRTTFTVGGSTGRPSAAVVRERGVATPSSAERGVPLPCPERWGVGDLSEDGGGGRWKILRFES